MSTRGGLFSSRGRGGIRSLLTISALSPLVLIVSTLRVTPAAALFPDPVFETGSYPASIAVGDFNGDGRSDLAVANFDSGDVSVLLGVGDGTVGPQMRLTVGFSLSSVAIGDFNGDGRQDLAVTDFTTNYVSVLLGVGDGTFGLPKRFAAGSGPMSVAVGDFDGDGREDLAA